MNLDALCSTYLVADHYELVAQRVFNLLQRTRYEKISLIMGHLNTAKKPPRPGGSQKLGRGSEMSSLLTGLLMEILEFFLFILT